MPTYENGATNEPLPFAGALLEAMKSGFAEGAQAGFRLFFYPALLAFGGALRLIRWSRPITEPVLAAALLLCALLMLCSAISELV